MSSLRPWYQRKRVWALGAVALTVGWGIAASGGSQDEAAGPSTSAVVSSTTIAALVSSAVVDVAPTTTAEVASSPVADAPSTTTAEVASSPAVDAPSSTVSAVASSPAAEASPSTVAEVASSPASGAEDASDDVVSVQVGEPDDAGMRVVHIEIKNHGAERSNYHVRISLQSRDGAVEYATTDAYLENVEPGGTGFTQSAPVSTSGLPDAFLGAVKTVSRTAAG